MGLPIREDHVVPDSSDLVAGAAMIKEWIAGHAAEIRRRAELLCGDPDLAKDLCHDAFVRMLVHQEQASSIRNFEAWAITIMTRLYYDWRDRERVRRSGGTAVELQLRAPEREPIPEWATFSLEHVMAAVALLEPAERQLFQLRERLGWKYSRIAAELGLPEGTVAARLHRVRARLRVALLAARDGSQPERGSR